MKVTQTRKGARELLLNAVFEQDLCPVHRDALIVAGAQQLVEKLTEQVDERLAAGGLSGLEDFTKKVVRSSVIRSAVAGVNDALGELLIDERIGVEK